MLAFAEVFTFPTFLFPYWFFLTVAIYQFDALCALSTNAYSFSQVRGSKPFQSISINFI